MGLLVFIAVIHQRKNCRENNDKNQLDPEIEIIGYKNDLLIGIKSLYLFDMSEKFQIKKSFRQNRTK
jgi:hypothetical protein